MSGRTNRALFGALAAMVICAATSGFALAQDMPSAGSSAPIIPPVAPAPDAIASQLPQADAQPAPAQPAAQKLADAQLDQLVAPIALYPDPILSQMLMASTYPLEVVEATRWVREPANKPLTGDALTAALKEEAWDPSVMALVPFPQVLAVMADQVQWTEQLGNAFLAQQSDVMASVQRLRHAALAAGNLKTTPQCHCIIQTMGDQIAILPSEPKVVCIPVYDPRYVYGGWREPAYPPILFPPPIGFVYAPGFWIGFEPPIEVAVFGPLWGWGWFDWTGGRIVIDNTVFGGLDPSRAAFANGTWVHDPAHRRGVAYANNAMSARFSGAVRPASLAVTRGAGAGRGFVAGSGLATRGAIGHGVQGSFHGNAFARGAVPQFARGHTAANHLSPGGGPHVVGFAHGPVGGGPHGGGPGGGPHGGGGGHHH
jgi:hypothetical protein